MKLKYDIYLATQSGILFYCQQIDPTRESRFYVDGRFICNYNTDDGLHTDWVSIRFWDGLDFYPKGKSWAIKSEHTSNRPTIETHGRRLTCSVRSLPSLPDLKGKSFGLEKLFNLDSLGYLNPPSSSSDDGYDGNTGTLTSRCRNRKVRLKPWQRNRQDSVYGPVTNSSFKRNPYRR